MKGYISKKQLKEELKITWGELNYLLEVYKIRPAIRGQRYDYFKEADVVRIKEVR